MSGPAAGAVAARRPTSGSWGAALAALALAGVVSACGDDRGVIEGQWLSIEGCGDDGGARVFEPFRLRMDIFGLERGFGPMYVRGQDGAPATAADSFVVVVDDESALRAWRIDHPGAALPFGGEGAAVRGALTLADSCPDSYLPLEAHGGTIIFDSLGHDTGDRVELRMFDFSIRDGRTGEIVGTGFSGEMDFEVRGGRPYQAFPH